MNRVERTNNNTKQIIAFSAALLVGAGGFYDFMVNQPALRDQVVRNSSECDNVNKTYGQLEGDFNKLWKVPSLVESLKDPVIKVQTECFTAARNTVKHDSLDDNSWRAAASLVGGIFGSLIGGFGLGVVFVRRYGWQRFY